MGDFSAEDLFDAVDRVVADLLARHGVTDPPVDALLLAQEAFDLHVREADDDDDGGRPGRFGPRPPRRPRPDEVVVRADMSDEARQAVAARACGKRMTPAILAKVGVAPGTENRGALNSLAGLVAPRLLLPTRWFAKDARKAGYDLAELKARYPTAGYEALAMRTLDLDEPCVVAVVDDGTVAARRGNRAPATKQLTAAEKRCLDLVEEHREPQRARADGWTAWGWPVPTGPFNRILLRSVPDDV